MLPNWALFLSEPNGWDIHIQPFNPLAPLILLIPLVILRRRGKSAGYLLCFSLFFFYLWAVCAYAICPLPIEPDLVGWLRSVQRWDERINLRPGVFLQIPGFWNNEYVYGNFLLGASFGFGLPFVVPSTPARALRLGFAFAAGLELSQLAISVVIYRFPYRSIDIDDVILVFAGVLFGYWLLLGAAGIYRLLGWAGGARVPVWNHMHAVLLGVASGKAPLWPSSSTAQKPDHHATATASQSR